MCLDCWGVQGSSSPLQVTAVHSSDKCFSSAGALAHLNYVALLFCLFKQEGN